MSKANNLSKKNIAKSNDELISFKNFFTQSLNKGLVNTWQEDEIWAFFKDHGLKEKDSLKRYSELLKKY